MVHASSLAVVLVAANAASTLAYPAAGPAVLKQRDLEELDVRGLGGLFKAATKGASKLFHKHGHHASTAVDTASQMQQQQQQQPAPQRRELEIEERGPPGTSDGVTSAAGRGPARALGGGGSRYGGLAGREFGDALPEFSLRDLSELEERGLGGLFKFAAKGAGKLLHLGGGSSSQNQQQQQQQRREFVVGGFLSTRELDELVGRDLEDIDVRDLEDIDARDMEFLEERGLGGIFKIGAKAVGKLFGGGGGSSSQQQQQQQQRREVDVFDLRDIHDLDAREYEEIVARNPGLGGILRVGSKVAGKIFGGFSSGSQQQQQQQRREFFESSLEDLD